MASRHAEFRRLLEQATTASERDPDAFRRDTVWLAVRGYSFVLSMLLFFVVITIGLPFLFAWFHLTAIGIKLALASLVLVVAVLRSLALPIPQPEGIALQEQTSRRARKNHRAAGEEESTCGAKKNIADPRRLFSAQPTVAARDFKR